MSADPGSDLHIVSEEGAGETPAPSSESRSEPLQKKPAPQEKRRKPLPWLAIVFAVIAAVMTLGYGIQRERATRLEDQNVELGRALDAAEMELTQARDRLAAAEARMEVVRGHVTDLAGRVQLLQEAVGPQPD